MEGRWARRLLRLAVALWGLYLVLVVGRPLPFLLGPMLACLGVALLGAPLKGYGPVTGAPRTNLGVAVGASVTPTLVAQLPSVASCPAKSSDLVHSHWWLRPSSRGPAAGWVDSVEWGRRSSPYPTTGRAA
jgi:hypothetical protein